MRMIHDRLKALQETDAPPTDSQEVTEAESQPEQENSMLDFESELDRIASSQMQSVPDAIDPFERDMKAMEGVGRIKGATVFDVIRQYPTLQEEARIASALPPTQASVERLFSALKILRSDLRTSLKEDILSAILFLKVNGLD